MDKQKILRNTLKFFINPMKAVTEYGARSGVRTARFLKKKNKELNNKASGIEKSRREAISRRYNSEKNY